MNKIKEIINKIKEQYMKINPMAREIIETIVFVRGNGNHYKIFYRRNTLDTIRINAPDFNRR